MAPFARNLQDKAAKRIAEVGEARGISPSPNNARASPFAEGAHDLVAQRLYEI